MPTTPDDGKVVCLRLSVKADDLLREHLVRKGDVSRRVNEAVQGTDLEHVTVVPRGKAPGSGRETFMNTSVKFLPGVYEEAARVAKAKGVSASALIDAVLVQFFSQPRAAEVNYVESDSSNGDKPKRRRR